MDGAAAEEPLELVPEEVTNQEALGLEQECTAEEEIRGNKIVGEEKVPQENSQ